MGADVLDPFAMAESSAHTRYAKCIEASKRIRWDIDRDVTRGRQFDFCEQRAQGREHAAAQRFDMGPITHAAEVNRRIAAFLHAQTSRRCDSIQAAESRTSNAVDLLPA